MGNTPSEKMNDETRASAGQERAVLFADVCDSTRLYEVLGDERAFAAISDCLSTLQRLTAQHSGRVVKVIGDEIMAVFPDASAAAQAACMMQVELHSRPPVGDWQMAIRIGFHFGPVLENAGDGDVFGDTVNTASRMAEVAKAQQIVTTGATVMMLPPVMRTSTRPMSALAIKGKAEAVEVREVIWHESDDMTMMVGNTFPPKANEPFLKLAHRGDVFIVDAEHPSFTIGRDKQADIVVEDIRASRLHARIERRRDKFVFVDLSSNGSYILVAGEAEVALRREEFVLRKSGSISLGHSYHKDPSEIIEFFCLN